MVRRLEAVFAKGIKVRTPSVEDVLGTPFNVDSNLWEVKREMRENAMVGRVFSHGFGRCTDAPGCKFGSLAMKQTGMGCGPDELSYYTG